MVTNKIQILIGDVDYSAYAILPLKVGELLDERLDESSLTLRAVRRDVFKPFTEVRIRVINTKSVRSFSSSSERSYDFIVANDSATEMPIGSGLYNHDLYLIERTKLLETIVVESITFRNSLKMREITEAPPFITALGTMTTSIGVDVSNLRAVYSTGEITLPSAWNLLKISDYYIDSQFVGVNYVEILVKQGGTTVYSVNEEIGDDNEFKALV